jgi:hypothetical protein
MFGDAPEDEGWGRWLIRTNMNLHFVNVTDHNVLMELWST